MITRNESKPIYWRYVASPYWSKHCMYGAGSRSAGDTATQSSKVSWRYGNTRVQSSVEWLVDTIILCFLAVHTQIVWGRKQLLQSVTSHPQPASPVLYHALYSYQSVAIAPASLLQAKLFMECPPVHSGSRQQAASLTRIGPNSCTTKVPSHGIIILPLRGLIRRLPCWFTQSCEVYFPINHV